MPTFNTYITSPAPRLQQLSVSFNADFPPQTADPPFETLTTLPAGLHVFLGAANRDPRRGFSVPRKHVPRQTVESFVPGGRRCRPEQTDAGPCRLDTDATPAYQVGIAAAEPAQSAAAGEGVQQKLAICNSSALGQQEFQTG